MEIGSRVFYFAALPDQTEGKILVATVISRSMTEGLLDIQVIRPDFNVGGELSISQATSLEQCLESGGYWCTREQLIGWGVDLEDGDQVLSEIVTPE